MTASVDNDAFFRFAQDRGLLSDADAERCRQICQQTGREAVDVVRDLDLLTTSYAQLARQTLADSGNYAEAPTKVTPPQGPPAASTQYTPLNQLPDEALAGQRLGRYQLVELLGQGGMGVAYRAWDTALEREVAIKIIRQQRQDSFESQARFLREARAVAGMGRHPNIVSVYELGNQEDTSYFTMELVVGQSMAEWRLQKRPSVREVIEVGLGITRGMAYAHDRGVIHRDLKPDNIMINGDDGRPLVTDFGVAREVEADQHLTATGTVIGTPGYLAPEQAGGYLKITPACDIYSLGVVLYEALAGSLPFLHYSAIELLIATMQQPPEPLRQRAPQIPREVEAIVMHCLAKLPEQRPRHMNDLADQLQAWLNGRSLTAPWLASSSQTPVKAAGAQALPRSKQKAPGHTMHPVSVPLRAPGKSKTPDATQNRLPMALAAVSATLMALMGYALLQQSRDAAPVKADSLLSPLATDCTLSQPVDGLVTATHEVRVVGEVDPPHVETVWIRDEKVTVSSGRLSHELNLPDGPHLLRVSATQDGQPLAELTIHVDTTKPILVIESPTTDAITRGTAILVSGTVDDENPRNIAVAGLDPTPLTRGEGFSLQMPLPEQDGRYQIEIVVDDKANHQATASVSVVVDRTPPTVSVTELVEGATAADNTLTVHGAVNDAHPKSLSVNGQDVPLGDEGQFRSEVRLPPDGEVTITLEATDDAGNRSAPLVKTIANDQSPPLLTLDSPATGFITSASTIRVAGHASDTQGTVDVVANQLILSVGDDGRFEGNLPLEDGDNILVLTARDAMGNETSTTLRVTRDTTPPQLKLDPLEKEEWTGRRVKIPINGQLGEDDCTVIVNGKLVEVRERRFKTKVSHKATEQLHEVTIEVIATDALGNTTREQIQVLHYKDKARKGWHDERLPLRLVPARRGGTKIYLWQPPAGPPLELVYIPAGTFNMGVSEEINKTLRHSRASPAHSHPMPQGYWIGRFEVTRAQYHAFCHATGKAPPDQDEAGRGDHHPATRMTQTEARAFCDWAGDLRLPTEAQWEKAARGPNSSPDDFKYAWGNEEPGPKDVVGGDFSDIMPVAYQCKDVSPYGAWHMTGNVSEWTADLLESGAYVRYAQGDFAPPSRDEDTMVKRGGQARSTPDRCNVVYRDDLPSTHRSDKIGFRVVVPATASPERR